MWGTNVGGGWYACLDKASSVGRMSGDVGTLRKCEVKTLMTSGHTAFQVHNSWYGQAEIGRSSWEGLITRRLRFVVHAAGLLHSMVLHDEVWSGL